MLNRRPPTVSGSAPCRFINPHLAAYIVGDLPPAQYALLTEHLQRCPTCAEAVRDAEAFERQARAAAAHYQPRMAPPTSLRIQQRVYQRMRGSLTWHRGLSLAGSLGNLVLLVGLLGSLYWLWQTQLRPLMRVPLVVPGGHRWAAEQHDAYGTLWTEAHALHSPEIAWWYPTSAGFTGGPVVAADGTLYANTQDGYLLALRPNGRLRWKLRLPAQPIRTPTLGASGHIYVVDELGALSAVTPAGELAWNTPAHSGAGLSSPIAGPDETLYYAAYNGLVAVDAEGQPLWESPLPTYSYISPLPRLSPDGRFLFFSDTVTDARTGVHLFGPTGEPLDSYLIGGDSRIYLQQQLRFEEWLPTQAGVQLLPVLEPRDASAILHPFPIMAGVTPDGHGWVFASSATGEKLAWLDQDWLTWSGQQAAPQASQPIAGRVIAVDASMQLYRCEYAFATGQPSTCQARPLGADQPAWQIDLEYPGRAVLGGALVPGWLYLTTESGRLFALREAR